MRLSIEAWANSAFRRIQIQHVSIVVGLSLAAVLALSVRGPAVPQPVVVSAHQAAVPASTYRTTAEGWSVVFITDELSTVERVKAALWEEASTDNGSMGGFEAFWSGGVLLVSDADGEAHARALVDAARGADYFADPGWRFLVFDLRPEQDRLWSID
jgi:hypothetical protein